MTFKQYKLFIVLLIFSLVVQAYAHVAPVAGTLQIGPKLPASESNLLRSRLPKQDRERLAAMLADGKTEIPLAIASTRGANNAVARQVAMLGGTIRYRADEVDYLRVSVPARYAEALTRVSDVYTVNVEAKDPDYFYHTPVDPSNADAVPFNPISVDIPATSKAPDRNLPPENPYLPTAVIGAPQFVARNPTWDGRGTTIAILETTPDLLCPELQSALTIDGRPVRKISRILNSVDPIDDADAPGWVRMSNVVTADNRKLTYADNTYTAPRDGQFRFGLWSGGSIPKEVRKSIGPGENNDEPIAVLWDESSATVWVDTNHNHDFSDEKALQDYNVQGEFAILGMDNPATRLRETAGFTVWTNTEHKLVYINLATSEHTTEVASVAAGHSFFGGNFNGSAPAARLLPVVYGNGAHGLIEGMLAAARQPDVDLITVQIATTARLNAGQTTMAVVWDRIVEYYHKPIFDGAGNSGPGLNTVGDECGAGRVICVGGYVSKETWKANASLTARRNDYVRKSSARGPTEDGNFGPDIIAPMMTLAASAGSAPSDTVKGTFTLPPGYWTSVGNSFSTPMAAGAASLLVSAAKQSGTSYDEKRLKRALKSSARYLPEFAAHEQGAGLMNVGAAWDVLRNAPDLPTITSRAPVNTVLARELRVPQEGSGIYEREGWQAGQSAQRRIILTRTSGAQRALIYDLRWIGSDGTFTGPSQVTLPLNVPMKVEVTVAPKTPGVHSAILNIVEPKSLNVVHQVMNTIVAAEHFTSNNAFEVRHEGHAEYPEYTSYFLYVPPDTAALTIVVNITNGSLRPRVMNPAGAEIDQHGLPPSVVNWYRTGLQSRTIPRPEPGVWEILLDNGDEDTPGIRSSDAQRASFILTAAIQRADATKPLVELEPSRLGSSFERLSFTNRFASFKGGVVEAPLASAFSDRPRLRSGGPMKLYEINVPPGAANLSASITKSPDKYSEVSLYLFDCTGDRCEIRDADSRPGAVESVYALSPKAGRWKVVIDAIETPANGVALDYLDIFGHRAFGTIAPTDGAKDHPTGEEWREGVKVTVNAYPTAGRTLAGVVGVASEKADTVRYKRPGLVITYDPTKWLVSAVQQRVPLGTTLLSTGPSDISRVPEKTSSADPGNQESPCNQ